MARKAKGPPKTFVEFGAAFPKIAQAWEYLADAGAEGPLDEKTQRLIKLAVSIGARAEGATHSAVRKAVEAGATREDLYQVVALTSSTIGLPGAVAAFTWIRETL